MALTKVNYVDNVTVIGATNLNAIQDEIIANGNAVVTLSNGKVDKVTGKGLSTNDFSDEAALKLSNIESGATHVLVDDQLSTSSTNAIQNKVVAEKIQEIAGVDPYGAYEEKTVSGAVAHFQDGANDVPVKNLVVNVDPVQDLHGYDNPWPAGGSNNLIPDGTDTSNGYVDSYYLNADNTETSSSNWYISEYFPITAEETYTWSSNYNVISISICFYDSSKNYLSGVQSSGELPKTFVAPANAVYCRATQGKTFNTYGQQIETGSTATTIKPFSNVCPISGKTKSTLWHTSKNMLETITANKLPASDSKVTVSNGVVTLATSNTTTGGIVFPVKGGVSYRVGFNVDGGSTYLRIAEYSGKPTIYDSSLRIREIVHNDSALSSGKVTRYFTASENAKYVFIGVYRSYNTATRKLSNIFANLYEDGSDYETYSGTTIPITFPDAAETVYGGTLTLEDGSWVLTVTDGNIASYNGETLPSTWISSMDVYEEGVTPTTGAQVVYKLATPIEYTLTGEVVETLLGVNNIWADTGDSTVTYRADPTISSKARELVIKAIIAPVLTEMKADTALVANDFRIVGDTLYKITSSIANGGTLTVGTNCTATTIGEQLKALLNA